MLGEIKLGLELQLLSTGLGPPASSEDRLWLFPVVEFIMNLGWELLGCNSWILLSFGAPDVSGLVELLTRVFADA